MLSVLLWKEYREHRMVWVALAFVAAASLLFLPVVMAPGGLDAQPNVRSALRGLIIVLSWTYGLICGAMLLAGEREVGTLPFLDALPGLRWRLWLAKGLAGLLLVFAQIIFLVILATATHLFASGADAAWTVNALFWAGLYGFAWGMLFSSFGRSVMNMILLALAAQFAAFFITSLLAGFLVALTTLATGEPMRDDPFRIWGPIAAGVALLTIAPTLAGSAFLFTRLDCGRLQPPRTVSRTRKPRSPGWWVLIWLTWRQARGFAAGMVVLGLLIGLLMPLMGALVWPAGTLLVGILCGVTAFDDEQQGPFRYLGDQRLPLFRLWIVKVGVRLAVALTVAVLLCMAFMLVGLFNKEILSPAYSGMVIMSGPTLFLSMGLVYGFCLGILCGLLFRSLLASAVSALFFSVLMAAVWLPSLLAGGLHPWQALGPPLLLFAATPLLLRPWAARRVASWTTAKRFIPFLVIAGLWIVSGIWYRILEIPDVPAQMDLDAVRASLPTEKENKGGELMRNACLRFADIYWKTWEAQPSAPPKADAAAGWPPTLAERLADVLDHGWKGDDPKLSAWLDKLSANEWVNMLKEAAELPPGMVEDLRNRTAFQDTAKIWFSREITNVLAVQGLQRQAAGDDETFVENLHIALKLSLAMRHFATTESVNYAQRNEALLLKALDRWLEKLHGRPELLQQALADLTAYANATPHFDDDQDLMNDLVMMNSVQYPLPWLDQVYENFRSSNRDAPDLRAEAQMTATAWLVPWEHERQQRILRVAYWGGQQRLRALGPNAIGPLWMIIPAPGRPNKLTNVALERASKLKLALRWYAVDNGKPADNLDELVPKYLPSIPVDPFDPDGKPFRYRLSRGEEIEWPSKSQPAEGSISPPTVVEQPRFETWPPPAAKLKVPPEQGILWSVGPDERDDGGHRQAGGYDGVDKPDAASDKQDVIYLVPLPGKGK